MPYKDSHARREYARRYYHSTAARKGKQVERVRRLSLKVRQFTRKLIAAFRAAGCLICREATPCCLAAHHLAPHRKQFNIGDIVRLCISPRKAARELAKCVCLCHNCHAKLHAGLISAADLTAAAARANVKLPEADARHPEPALRPPDPDASRRPRSKDSGTS